MCDAEGIKDGEGSISALAERQETEAFGGLCDGVVRVQQIFPQERADM